MDIYKKGIRIRKIIIAIATAVAILFLILLIPQGKEYTIRYEFSDSEFQSEDVRTAIEQDNVEDLLDQQIGLTLYMNGESGRVTTKLKDIWHKWKNLSNIQAALDGMGTADEAVIAEIQLTMRGEQEDDELNFPVQLKINNDNIVVQSSGINTEEEPKEPHKEDYRFDGWYYINEQGVEAKWNFNEAVTTDLHLFARWEPVEIKTLPEVEVTDSWNTGGYLKRTGYGTIPLTAFLLTLLMGSLAQDIWIILWYRKLKKAMRQKWMLEKEE